MEELIFQKHFSDGGKLLVFGMSDDFNSLSEKICNFENYITEYQHISSDKRKKEFLNARWGINNLLDKEVTIKYNQDGKPFVENENVNISISHSGRWMALSSHPYRLTGVDVEVISTRAERICNKFLTEEELTSIRGKNRGIDFLLSWSAKEALYKIIGKDAVDFRKQLRIQNIEGDDNGTIQVLHIPTGDCYHSEFMIFKDFVVVICNGKS